LGKKRRGGHLPKKKKEKTGKIRSKKGVSLPSLHREIEKGNGRQANGPPRRKKKKEKRGVGKKKRGQLAVGEEEGFLRPRSKKKKKWKIRMRY